MKKYRQIEFNRAFEYSRSKWTLRKLHKGFYWPTKMYLGKTTNLNCLSVVCGQVIFKYPLPTLWIVPASKTTHPSNLLALETIVIYLNLCLKHRFCETWAVGDNLTWASTFYNINRLLWGYVYISISCKLYHCIDMIYEYFGTRSRYFTQG